MSHDEQHRRYAPGTMVVAADGEELGVIRAVYDHFVLVDQEGATKDLEVPSHAIRHFEDGRLHLSVNRRALSLVDSDEA